MSGARFLLKLTCSWAYLDWLKQMWVREAWFCIMLIKEKEKKKKSHHNENYSTGTKIYSHREAPWDRKDVKQTTGKTKVNSSFNHWHIKWFCSYNPAKTELSLKIQSRPKKKYLSYRKLLRRFLGRRHVMNEGNCSADKKYLYRWSCIRIHRKQCLGYIDVMTQAWQQIY